MKLASFRDAAGGVRVGAVEAAEHRILDLTETAGFADMLALIDAGEAGLDRVRALVSAAADGPWRDLANVTLLAPLPQPRQMRDGMSFATHIRQSGAGARRMAALLAGDAAGAAAVVPAADIDPVYRERPIYYLTNRMSVAGPDSVVQWPRYSRVADFELELAAVIGRTGHDIPAAEAGAHIFGYTIYNDFSARDAQMLEMAGRLGPAKGKSFDGGNVPRPVDRHARRNSRP